MLVQGVRIGSVSALLVLAAAVGVGAEGDARPAEGEGLTVTRKGGTRFLSLSDWPVTEKGGVMTVATLEEYLSLKFGQIRDRFEASNQRLEALERLLQAIQAKQEACSHAVQDLEQRIAAKEVTDGRAAQDTQTPESASQ